jgi:hypothetical protein
VSDERALRDALELAHAKSKKLERLLEEEAKDREALRRALDEAQRKLFPKPGEMSELLHLKAKLQAQQLQLASLTAERDRLQARITLLEQKPGERERSLILEELIELRQLLAQYEEREDE